MSNANAAVGDGRLVTIVTEKIREADDVVRFVLRPADDLPLPPFTAGAHVEVSLPNGLTRPYSLCNDPAAADHYEIAVLLERDGRGGSRAAHERVEVGDRLPLRPPCNLFPLADAGHALLIAGGIGVTPLLAMAETLARTGRDFAFHLCTRTASRAAFRARLAEPRFAGRVSFHVDDGPAEQRFDARAVLAAAPAASHLHVCGPGGFLDHVLATARELGWPGERVHFERFAAAPPVAIDGDAAFELVLARRGMTITVAPGVTAAEAMLAAGADTPLSCEQGICGTCFLPVLEGRPDHRDHVQTVADRAADRWFAPCCSRALTSRLVVDA